jgi:TetR/AcrR family transcriptional regulator, regulator of cefoperazone and chloramphenicol sensitivity
MSAPVGRPKKSLNSADTPADARSRLLQAALLQFAQHGFSAASTRAIAQEAQTNVASISYHFGDKEGLYKAVLGESASDVSQAFAKLSSPDLNLQQALAGIYTGFLASCASDDWVEKAAMKLHLRECADPSDQFRNWVRGFIEPMFAQLQRLLCRQLGVKRPDLRVKRLAFGLIAIANDYTISEPFMNELSPELRQSPQWIKETVSQLTEMAMAMVEAEAKLRQKKKS